MYLALRPPWASEDVQADKREQVAEVPGDAGVDKPKRKKRGGGRRLGGGGHRPGPGPGPGGDDEDWANSGGTEEGPEEFKPPRLVKLSASDRALEWRGDDTSPPKQALDMSSGAESRALDNSEIQATISSQSGPVQSCVVQAATNTDLSGTITVKMIVEGTGRVSRSRVQAPRYLHNQGVLACIQRAVRGMKFPPTGAPTLVTLPVHLTLNR
jgi:hypothetical protein